MTTATRTRCVALLPGCILLLLVVLSPALSQAQGLNHSRKKGRLQSFVSLVADDIVHVVSAPLRFGTEDGLRLFALSAITSGFVAFLDEPIDDEFIERDDFYVDAGVALAEIGDVYDRISSPLVVVGLAAPMLTAGLLFEDPKLLTTTRLMVESFLVAGAITFFGKRILGRSRPYVNAGAHDFDPFRSPSTKASRSMPSGHTTSAFATMTVLAKQYRQWWIRVPAYTIAVSVALQRIESRSHWGSDVILGGAIGYWVGHTLVNKGRQAHRKTSLQPLILQNQLGVVIAF